MSRLYGGIHHPSDITAGLSHGQRIAAYTLTVAKNDGAQ
jgi:membrane-associated phospholipid phosphatase